MVWLETTSIQSYYENFIKIQLVLAVLEKIYSWFSLVRFGLVWYGMVWFQTKSIQSYCENLIKIRLVLTDLEKIYSWFSLVRFGLVWYGLVWYGMVWSGLRQHPSEAVVKISQKFHSNPTCFD